MRHILTSILIFALCGLIYSAPRAEATVDKTQLVQNEILRLQVQVIDDTAKKNPPQMVIPKFPHDFAFQIMRQVGPSSSTQSSMQIINGNVTQSSTVTQTMVFLLKPKQKGALTIPELQIQYGKEKLQTSPISLQVSDTPAKNQSTSKSNRQPHEAATQASPIFTQEFSADSAIAGVPVTLTMALMLPEQMDVRNISPEFDFHDLEKDFRVEWPDDMSRWETQPSKIINGIRYQAIGKQIRVTPRRPGKITLPPKAMTVIFRDPSTPTRRRGRFFDDFFDDPFFGGSSNLLKTTIASEEATLNVLDFPEEGKPDNFSGLIGPLTATAAIDLPEAQVGDPITLTITLQGTSINPGDSLPTDLKTQLEKKAQFRVSGDDTIAEQEDGTLTCTRTIRALTSDVKEIPAIEIPFFNLQTNSYDIAKTNPIDVTIEATQELTLKSSGVNMPPVAIQTMHPAQSETTLTRQEGISLESDVNEASMNTWSPLAGNSGRKGLMWYFILPALIWLVTAGATLLHRRGKRLSPAEIASRNALKNLRATLRKTDCNAPDAAIRLNAALQEFLAARLGRKGAVTVDDLNELSLDQATAETLRELLAQSEAAQYGGASIAATELKERILNAVRNF